jgi:small subunit ribosomal protein S6
VTHEENLGLYKLLYPIQKKKTGFYYLIEFQAEGSVINDLEIEMKREECIIRWQTIKLERFALQYADKRKKKLSIKTKQENNA